MPAFHDAIAGKVAQPRLGINNLASLRLGLKKEISVIAEIKRRSPSHGDFPQHAVKELMAAYKKGGAAAISVVTEPTLFNGSLELLREVRRTTELPILRKDFITTVEQIKETAEAGANAILLIARMLDKKTLSTLCEMARKAGLDPVVEIHDEMDLRKIFGLPHIIIGINNRDLTTFQADVRHAQKILNRIDPHLPIIAESAFQSPEELRPYRGKIDAVLIGTAFLTAPNPFKKLFSFTKFVNPLTP